MKLAGWCLVLVHGQEFPRSPTSRLVSELSGGARAEIAAQLRLVRAQQRMSAADLEQIAAFEPGTVERIEAADSSVLITGETLLKLARCFGHRHRDWLRLGDPYVPDSVIVDQGQRIFWRAGHPIPGLILAAWLLGLTVGHESGPDWLRNALVLVAAYGAVRMFIATLGETLRYPGPIFERDMVLLTLRGFLLSLVEQIGPIAAGLLASWLARDSIFRPTIPAVLLATVLVAAAVHWSAPRVVFRRLGLLLWLSQDHLAA